MGLFDFLFGKRRKPDLDDPTESSVAAPAMPSAEEWEDMEWPAKIEWLGRELEAVKAACDKAGIRTRPDALEAELRGNLRGRPIAAQLDDDGLAELRVKFVNRRGLIGFGRPTPGQASSDASDGDDGEFWQEAGDTVSPLVAPGLVIHTTQGELAGVQAIWAGLDPAMQQRIAQAVRERFYYIAIRHQEVEGDVSVGPLVQVPVAAAVLQGLDDLIAIAELFGQGDAPVAPRAGGPGVAPPERRVCSYCTTTYYLDMGDPRCPACGANN